MSKYNGLPHYMKLWTAMLFVATSIYISGVIDLKNNSDLDNITIGVTILFLMISSILLLREYDKGLMKK